MFKIFINENFLSLLLTKITNVTVIHLETLDCLYIGRMMIM